MIVRNQDGYEIELSHSTIFAYYSKDVREDVYSIEVSRPNGEYVNFEFDSASQVIELIEALRKLVEGIK